MNVQIEIIKVIDKNNKHADCPMYKAEETWDHTIMCVKNKQIIDEWIKNIKYKFKVTIKYGFSMHTLQIIKILMKMIIVKERVRH